MCDKSIMEGKALVVVIMAVFQSTQCRTRDGFKIFLLNIFVSLDSLKQLKRFEKFGCRKMAMSLVFTKLSGKFFEL